MTPPDPEVQLVVDGLRIATLMLWVWSTALALATAVRYHAAGHRALETAVDPNRLGLLSRHVVVLAIRDVGLTSLAAWQLLIRIGQPLTGYLPVTLALFAAGVYALHVIGRYERLRVRDLEQPR